MTEQPTKAAGSRKQLIRVAKWLIALAVAVGLLVAARSAINQWQAKANELRQEISELDQQIAETDDQSLAERLTRKRNSAEASLPTLGNLNWGKIALAALFYGLGLLPPCMVLREAVASLGHRPSLPVASAAQLMGHLGKYVPGKAMVIVLRAGVLSTENIPVMVSTISVFMETLLMMAVGAAIAGVVICWLPVPAWMIATAAMVAVCASIPTLPPILRRVAIRIAKRAPESDNIENPTSSTRFFLVGWAWSLLSWVLIGTAFALIVSAIPNAQPSKSAAMLWAVATAAVALAMVVGFASLLPGGAGVRELVLTIILSPSVGPAAALLAAIAARVMFIVVESIAAGTAWLWIRSQRKPSEDN